jgi:SAM-dependent methyltransferase
LRRGLGNDSNVTMNAMDEGSGNGARWDRKYAEGLPSLTRPDPFFLSAYERFVFPRFPRAGTGLDVAGGLGRHALWLAARNWKMSLLDVSEVAIGQLRDEAQRLDLGLDLSVADAAAYDFRRARYDLIVLFYHFDRSLFPKIVSALNPGGLFICKMAMRWPTDVVSSNGAGNVLSSNEIGSLVPSLNVLDHRERPVRDRGVVEFVGSKPEAL